MLCGGEDPLLRKTGNEGLRLWQGWGPFCQLTQWLAPWRDISVCITGKHSPAEIWRQRVERRMDEREDQNGDKCGLWVSKKVKDPIDWNNVAHQYETYVSMWAVSSTISWSNVTHLSLPNLITMVNYCAGLNLQFRPSFRISHSKDKDLKH